MRLFVTGARGQLGRALERAARSRRHTFVGVDLPELDITDGAAVKSAVAAARPDAIVNCAAFTAVDAAESREAEALEVNGKAVQHLVRAASASAVAMVQLSTDYVFDGRATSLYGEDDPPNPLSAYGRTKLAGELAAARAERHLIVRTAWLFGEGNNFVGAIRRQLEAGVRTLRVVADQTGCPTYAGDLAEAVLRLIEARARGVLHVVNSGSATWCEFAREIVRQLNCTATVEPISTLEAARPAPRPAYSVLDASRAASLLGSPLPHWTDALSRFLASTVEP